MTRDDVIRMAREAKIINGPLINYSYAEFEKLERFAALVAAHEREECAKVAYQHEYGPGGAAAIRARGNQ